MRWLREELELAREELVVGDSLNPDFSECLRLPREELLSPSLPASRMLAQTPDLRK